MNCTDNNIQEIVDYKNIALPIGIAKAQGPIEDFVITIYDRTGSTYQFRVTGGNICICNNQDAEHQLSYEVR